MSHLDNLPRRDRNQEIEDQALSAFTGRIVESGSFILQGPDRKDYGTDCHLEVVADGQVTNVRIQAQLKGAERALNADGSLSVDVQQTTLNYLLMQPHSFFACYHLPTQSLRICPASSVLRQYEHSEKSWTEQKTLTVSFREALTIERLRRLAALARSGAGSSRDRYTSHATAQPAELPGAILNGIPDVHVPDDRAQAAALMETLYESHADVVISANFDKFAAVLSPDDDLMGLAYMSEINLGMANMSQHLDRIRAGIVFFRSRIGQGRYADGSLFYTLANARSALGEDENAKLGYQAALADPLLARMPDLAAQATKNLGTSFERLGEPDRAIELYQKSLQLSPDLPEAHNALGNHFVRIGRYEAALHHFDRVIYADRYYGKTSSVSGWRANVLFNLGRGQEAFREINNLLNQGESHAWIWPWSFRLVASFGRANVGNAQLARPFWERYVKAHPNSSHGRWELLMNSLYLRGQGYDFEKTFVEFQDVFDRHIARIDPQDAALPWDRLGHWAQEEDDWTQAERCFRMAYDLEGGHYGYCLGVALNHLNRYEEGLPLLLEQAHTLQPDAMSWFQVGISYLNLGQTAQAISAMQSALDTDAEYAPAAFELGGLYWNSGDQPMARKIWSVALERFPDHEPTGQARALMQG